jgi:pimeloyl-ACP methyl ester carboxylesterase
MKPVLLLIPGMLNTAAVWVRLVPLLEEVAEVRIANVQTQTSIAAMATDALAMVADMPPEQPLVICGFSMGGVVAIEIIAASTRNISAICLLGTSGRPESAEGSVLREKTIAAIERDFDKVTVGVARYAAAAQTQTNEALMADMVTLMRAVGPATAIAQNRAIMARSDHRAALAQLKLPVLVLCGKDDQITPPILSEELAALIPGAQLAWIEAAGHMTPMEQPVALAIHLKTFLSRVLSN